MLNKNRMITMIVQKLKGFPSVTINAQIHAPVPTTLPIIGKETTIPAPMIVTHSGAPATIKERAPTMKLMIFIIVICSPL